MDSKQTIDFILLRPAEGNGRRSFSLVKRTGRRHNSTLKLPEIDAINAAYQKGTIDYDSALDQCKDIRARLYRQFSRKYNFNADNKRILDEYWNKRRKHRQHKNEFAKQSAYHRLNRAITALEDLSLLSATKDEMQAKIAEHPQQRRIAAALNQLLKYIERPNDVLELNRKRRKPVKHITEIDLKRVLGRIPNDCPWPKEYILLCQAAFGTGCRLGELFGLEKRHIRYNGYGIFVQQQLMKDLTIEETKTGASRDVPILDGFKDAVAEWIAVPIKVKKEMRGYGFARAFTNACRKAFPNEKEKHLIFKDLRHCYAIALLESGEEMSVVAGALGNAEQVCNEYYTGFELTKTSMEGVVARIKARSKGKKKKPNKKSS
jgi:integrase